MKASTPELMKFQRLMRRLKESRRGTIGLLEGLWMAVAKNCPRGDIGKFSNEEIAIMVDWDGDPDELITALVETRWIDECSVERLVVHDWSDHCPTYIKGGLTTKGQQIAIATPYSPKLEPPAKGSSLEPVSSYSSLSSSVQTTSKDSSEPLRASDPVDTSITFSCVGKDPGPWNPPLKLIQVFRDAYPHHDVVGELRKAVAWIVANPGKRKTKKGMPAFLNRWMERAKPSTDSNATRQKTQAEKDAILAEARAQRAKEDGRDGA